MLEKDTICDSFKDKELVCQECGKRFLFTKGEQEYFYRRGLVLPRRCPQCRFLRRLSEVRR